MMKWLLVAIIALCNTFGDVLNTAGMKRQGEVEDRIGERAQDGIPGHDRAASAGVVSAVRPNQFATGPKNKSSSQRI